MDIEAADTQDVAMTEPPTSPPAGGGPPPGLPTALQINLPPEQAEGHYADFASIWHNNETFILDFVAMEHPPTPGEDPGGNPVALVNCRVVTRVRIPAGQVWEVMRALENQLTAFEAEHPERKPPAPSS